jgi:hemerythrin
MDGNGQKDECGTLRGVIDQEHKALEALIAKVQGICGQPDAELGLMHALTDMYLYAKAHFFDEEWLMERLGYPERVGHAARHREFLERTHDLADACLDGRLDYSELAVFLSDWLARHVEEEDARIMAYARQTGQEQYAG